MTDTFEWLEINNKYKNGQLKDHLDCKNYIGKFFYPLTNGTHALVENNDVTIIQDDTMRKVYLKRFPKDVKIWYETETIPVKLICDITKPSVGDGYVNIAKRQLHNYATIYKNFKPELRQGVDKMLSYVKEVWANGNEEVFNYLIKWLSNVAQGKKNSICLFLKGDQGIGKSTFLEFLVPFVFGQSVCCKGKSDHLKGEHNLQLLGKILVYFEELQIFSDKEWHAIDSELKDMITSTTASYADKYEKRFEAENLNNYIIITNKTTTKGIDGRRYFVLDLNPKRLGDYEYYGNLKKDCFNSSVGKAFFTYLMEVDTKGFNVFDFPETKNKMDLICELMSPVEKFLKSVYWLQKAPIHRIKPTILYNHYMAYDNNKHPIKLESFCISMRTLGFEHYKSNGGNIYNISYEELDRVAKVKKWKHELDETDENTDEDDEDDITPEQKMATLKNEIYAKQQQLQKLIDQYSKEMKIIENVDAPKQAIKKQVKSNLLLNIDINDKPCIIDVSKFIDDSNHNNIDDLDKLANIFFTAV